MRTVGVDAHVLTGKHQGSRVWLEGVLAKVGTIDRQNRWILYSGDPEFTGAAFPFSNFVHRSVPYERAIPRLLVGWPSVRKRDKLDVLLTQYIAPPFFGGKQCVVVHDILFESHPKLFPFPARWRNRLLVRLSTRLADVILVPSQFTRSELVKIYRLDPRRVVLAPNAVPLILPEDATAERASLIRILGEDWDRPFILSVGRIEPRKNVDLLLAAWRAVGRPDIMLVVVGKADFGAERTVRALRTDPNVRHLTDLMGNELVALYRKALVFVFPSSAEGFGIPILEALSVGTRVIHSNTTAMPEVGGEYTRTFDPLAPDSEKVLARLIEEEIHQEGRDPVSWMNLGPHLDQFTWERSARVLVDAVNAIVKA
jgi:glycosyltransferase involved in cell wall biosynthesis